MLFKNTHTYYTKLLDQMKLKLTDWLARWLLKSAFVLFCCCFQDVLPNFLGWLPSAMVDDASTDVCFGLVTSLLLHKVKHPADGSELSKILCYNLDFSSHSKRYES